MEIKFRHGEYWKKVFGPVLFYLNDATDDGDPYTTLWEDAKRQVLPIGIMLHMEFIHIRLRKGVS